MTVNNKAPVTGPTLSDGVKIDWPFDFKITAASQMTLIVRDMVTLNDETVTTGFTIDAAYIGNDTGGYVRYQPGGNPLPAGKGVFAVREVPYTQPVRIGNQGGFWPETHEQAFDNLAMQIQQAAEILGRSVRLPVGTDEDDLEALLADVIRLADSADNIDALAAIIPQINAVVVIDDDVVTVAQIAADVSAVANIDAQVSALAALATEIVALYAVRSDIAALGPRAADIAALGPRAADIGTVAGISANVTTVAGIAANVTTVAGISANVTTVAGISANVTAVAGNATNINTVATNIANVNKVAAVDTAVGQVAAIDDDVSIVAANIAAVQGAHQDALDAGTAKDAAETARDWSYAWSNYGEDVAVNDGVHAGYSAFHWSKKAEAAAGGGVSSWASLTGTITTAAAKAALNIPADTTTALAGKAATDLNNVSQSDARTKVGTGTMAYRNVTISSSAPSGGVDGDIWFVVP